MWVDKDEAMMGGWIKIIRPLVFKPPSYRRLREVRSSGKPVHSRHVGARNEDAFSGSPFSLIPPVIVTDHCTFEGTGLKQTAAVHGRLRAKARSIKGRRHRKKRNQRNEQTATEPANEGESGVERMSALLSGCPYGTPKTPNCPSTR